MTDRESRVAITQHCGKNVSVSYDAECVGGAMFVMIGDVTDIFVPNHHYDACQNITARCLRATSAVLFTTCSMVKILDINRYL